MDEIATASEWMQTTQGSQEVENESMSLVLSNSSTRKYLGVSEHTLGSLHAVFGSLAWL